MRFIQLLLFFSLLGLTLATCHYSCTNCLTEDYYTCSVCKPNRGNNGVAIGGMCYCDNSSDENETGDCETSGSFNYRSKVLIVVFISLTLLFAIFAIVAKGMKYFLYKTIEDVQ